MKYHLIEGKDILIMTGDLAKVKRRKRQMEVSTRTSRYNGRKREFRIVEAPESEDDYFRKPNTQWKNYGKDRPFVTKQKRQ